MHKNTIAEWNKKLQKKKKRLYFFVKYSAE